MILFCFHYKCSLLANIFISFECCGWASIVFTIFSPTIGFYAKNIPFSACRRKWFNNKVNTMSGEQQMVLNSKLKFHLSLEHFGDLTKVHVENVNIAALAWKLEFNNLTMLLCEMRCEQCCSWTNFHWKYHQFYKIGALDSERNNSKLKKFIFAYFKTYFPLCSVFNWPEYISSASEG